MKPATTLAIVWLFAPDLLGRPSHDGAALMMVAAASDGAMGATVSESIMSKASITIAGNYRIIRANGLPDHFTGRFPNEGNPHHIAAQNYEFRVPLHPKFAEKP